MQTHIWNALDAAEIRVHHLAGAEDRTLLIAVSLASQDGVYDQADLRRALEISDLPEDVQTPLWEYLDGERGRDLQDLRAFLRGLPTMELDVDDDETDHVELEIEALEVNHLPHHAPLVAAMRTQAAQTVRPSLPERLDVDQRSLFDCLRREEDGLPQRLLAARLNWSAGRTQRVLDALVKEGHVGRNGDRLRVIPDELRGQA